METNLLFQLDVLLRKADHVTTGQTTHQSVVSVNVLLELGSTADQQSTTPELDQFTPD